MILKLTNHQLSIQTIISPANIDFIAWKHPEDNISFGSQVIVNESQEALLFENGQLITILGPGRHLVESGNIPGLESILKSAFGGASPLIVQIWFLNKVASFNYKWGSQIQVRDNTYGMLVPLGARGSYALRVKDPSSFVLQMVGVNPSFTSEQLRSSLLPLVERTLKDYIAKQVSEHNSDVFNISSRLAAISEAIAGQLQPELLRFGLELVDFYVQALDVVSDDPAFQAIKTGLAQAASLRIRAAAASDVGDFYQLERSLDALNSAASNDSGAAGILFSSGLGMGMGNVIGQQVIQSSDASKEHSSKQSEIVEKVKSLKELLNLGLITNDEFESRKGKLLDSF